MYYLGRMRLTDAIARMSATESAVLPPADSTDPGPLDADVSGWENGPGLP